MSAIEQTVHVGAVRHQQRGAGFKADPIGQREQLIGRGQHFFGQPAVAHHRDHSVADFPLGHAFTHCRDHARQFAARREWARGFELVHILDDQHIGEVDRAGFDRDPHLAWAGLRGLDLVELQCLGSANGVAT